MKGNPILFAFVLALIASGCWAGEITLSPATSVYQTAGVTPYTVGQYTPTVARPYDMLEMRVFDPECAKLDADAWKVLDMLAKRLFAEKWLNRGITPVWTPLAWPSTITQTYGQCPEGESLLNIDEAHGQHRPGWTFQKNKTEGVHVERGVNAYGYNWIVETYVTKEVITNTVTVEVEVEKECKPPVINNITLSLPALPPMPAPRAFLSPAMVGTVWSPAAVIPQGTMATSTETLATGTVVVAHKTTEEVKPPKPPAPPPPGPPSPYCPPGQAPTPPSSGDAAAPGTGGDIPVQGPPLGGVVPMPPPPGGYDGSIGSGDANLPGEGPPPPGPANPAPIPPPPGGSPVTPASIG